MRIPRTLRLALLALFALSTVSWAGQYRRYGDKTTRIIIFREGISSADRHRIAETYGAKVLRDLPFIDGVVVEIVVKPTRSGSSYRNSPAIEAEEDNSYRIWIQGMAAPGFDTMDPAGLGAQTRLVLEGAAAVRRRVTDNSSSARDGEIPWGIARVKASAVWSRTMGKGVKVGVIDTGIDSKHPDLAANYKGGVNIVDSSADPMDDNGHGSHVAGTIAAVKDGKGVVGVAPEASLYAIKVLDADGGGTPDAIVDGLQWAAEHKLNVVNLSLGGTGTAALKRAVKAAYKAGVTIVAASGNDPKEPVSSPANYPESIAVSASSKVDGIAPFASTGPEIAFIAPGVDIVSSAPGGGLAQHSGTSMASPHVAGLAALAIALGAQGPAQVRAALEAAAVPLKGLSKDQQGAGMIEADRLIR